jgi:hypothetical protein
VAEGGEQQAVDWKVVDGGGSAHWLCCKMELAEIPRKLRVVFFAVA